MVTEDAAVVCLSPRLPLFLRGETTWVTSSARNNNSLQKSIADAATEAPHADAPCARATTRSAINKPAMEIDINLFRKVHANVTYMVSSMSPR